MIYDIRLRNGLLHEFNSRVLGVRWKAVENLENLLCEYAAIAFVS